MFCYLNQLFSNVLKNEDIKLFLITKHNPFCLSVIVTIIIIFPKYIGSV